jgi:hypothetical protein
MLDLRSNPDCVTRNAPKGVGRRFFCKHYKHNFLDVNIVGVFSIRMFYNITSPMMTIK